MKSGRIASLFSASAVLALTAALAPGAGAAPSTGPAQGPSQPPIGQAPAVKIPARIWSVQRTPQPKENPSYVFSFSYSIEVRAANNEPLNTNIRIRRGVRVVSIVPAETLATLPVTAPAGGTAKVVFNDTAGLREGGCEATRFFFDLVGISGTTKLLVVQPGCTFSTTTEDPTAPIPPDTKQAQRANRLQYMTPAIEQQLACSGQQLKVTTTVKNATTKTASGVKLKLDGPEDASGPSITIQPGATASSTVAHYGKQMPGKYVLKLEDPNNSVGGAIYQMGWNLTLSRTCSPNLLPLESRGD